MASLRRWLRSVSDGFGWITLDPSPRLRRLREQAERDYARRQRELRARFGPLPPLPDEAYTEQGALLEPQDWPPC